MYLNESKFKAPFFIKAYEERQLLVNDQVYTSPIVIFENELKTDLLPASFRELSLAHIKQLIQLKPELILLGTGEQQEFLEHALLEAFAKKRIGIEVMNTLSAARTFNLLKEEGRKILGAFFP